MNTFRFIIAACVLCLSSMVFAAEDVIAFKDWIGPYATMVTQKDLAAFKNKLQSNERIVFEKTAPTTQALAVSLYTAYQGQKIDMPPYMAVKMACKMESGYYLHKGVQRALY
jgi:hypothetical protein